MCGIFGYIGVPGSLSDARLAEASALATHRGPDGHGYVLVDTARRSASFFKELPQELPRCDVVLAHRRLAILDVTEAGAQPMSCANGQLWITYNGEVYNFIELRAELERDGIRFRSGSDTEVVLRAYERWGAGCVNRFNGIFAFVILDLREGRLFAARDRFGVKPLHYVADAGDVRFAFASEIKQLLPFVDVRVNDSAVYEFLTVGAYDHAANTFFNSVRRLPPGHTLTVGLHGDTLEIRRYYAPTISLDNRIGAAAAAEQFRELLTDAVRLQLRSDVPVGSCLSGGLDSTSLVCLVRDLLRAAGGRSEQHTFSSHFDEAEANEREYMDAAISAAGVTAHIVEPTPNELLDDLEKLVWHQDEPFGSTSIYAQWRVFQAVNQAGIKVMLDGQGADEQLAGYLSFMTSFFSELVAKRDWVRLLWETWRFSRLQRQSWCGVLPRMRALSWCRRRDVSPPSFGWLRPSFAEAHSGQSEFATFLKSGPFPEEERLNNLCYSMVFHNNIPALVRYEDRDSMAWSVEARVPFLDHRLVEFVLSLPSTLKIRNGYTKWVLREGLRGTIPEKIRTRTSKLGFATPESKWQATILRPLILQALEDPRLQQYVEPQEARKYFEYISDKQVRDFLPWRWLNLVLWMDCFEVA